MILQIVPSSDHVNLLQVACLLIFFSFTDSFLFESCFFQRAEDTVPKFFLVEWPNRISANTHGIGNLKSRVNSFWLDCN